jgi:hypothetical protein
VWAGVDSAWEQEKLEARKMLINRADSHTSGARFVGWRFVVRKPILTGEQKIIIGYILNNLK